jgi:ankyrin repeat protein
MGVVKALLASQAECSSHNAAGDTPLILAAASGVTQAVQQFLDRRVDPDDVNGKRQTALHQAVQHENFAVVQALVDAGARVDVVDIYMNTPISKAKAKGLEAFLQILERGQQAAVIESHSLGPSRAVPPLVKPITLGDAPQSEVLLVGTL